jgi:hypothetical protein
MKINNNKRWISIFIFNQANHIGIQVGKEDYKAKVIYSTICVLKNSRWMNTLESFLVGKELQSIKIGYSTTRFTFKLND